MDVVGRASQRLGSHGLREPGVGRAVQFEPVFPSAPWGEYDDLSPELEETPGGWLRRHPIQQRRVWVVRRDYSPWGRREWVPDSPRTRYCKLQDRRFRIAPWNRGRFVVELYGPCTAERARVTGK